MHRITPSCRHIAPTHARVSRAFVEVAADESSKLRHYISVTMYRSRPTEQLVWRSRRRSIVPA